MPEEGIRIRRALLSVAVKDGLLELGACLAGHGVRLVASSGSAAALRAGGLECDLVADITGMGDLLGGRLKTLHPALLGGILCDRGLAGHDEDLARIGGEPFDLVAVNFYPFEEAFAAGEKLSRLIELIDIGGPTLARGAAKNHRHTVAIVDTDDYPGVCRELDKNDGVVSRAMARRLAGKVFAVTAKYEFAIARAMSACPVPEAGDLLDGLLDLREVSYGENQHQRGWRGGAAGGLRQVGGAELSYNNLQDSLVASRCVGENERPCCAIVKHASPCGVAVADSLVEAHAKALAADSKSAYGGVVSCNREVDEETLAAVRGVFCEVLVAPAFSAKALATLARLRRPRSLLSSLGGREPGVDARLFGGLALVQCRDSHLLAEGDLRQVTKRAPGAREMEDLLFAWNVAKHVRSNAVALVSDGATIGIGGGQPSRVHAARLAVRQASENGLTASGAVAASDAFFPFADGVACLAEAGVKAIIQPGGSKRDNEVIAVADEAGIAMVMTGVRHFSH